MSEREERLGRFLDRDRTAAFLDELDEPVSCIEAELHAHDRRRTYVRVQAEKEGRSAAASFQFEALCA
jgi:hypothetical protein